MRKKKADVRIEYARRNKELEEGKKMMRKKKKDGGVRN